MTSGELPHHALERHASVPSPDYSPRVELVDFLIDRCTEELEAASCTYEACEVGVRCLCETPDGRTLETIARLELVRRWGRRTDPTHDRLLRTMAEDHRDHPAFPLV